jgi:triacylglycerol esterase/lipase EstA (alpha/beta hydrolase family)
MRHTRLSSRLLTILFFFSLLLSAAQNVSAQNCVSAPSGLVGWWTGDGNANDSSGNANNGALQNGAAFATGKVGQSFSFNGDSQYVSIPHSESLNQSQEITVEAWVRLAELPRNVWGTVATKDNPDSGPYHLLIQQDGSVTWEVFTSAWVDINSGQNRITPGEFSHVAGSYKVSTGAFCVYVNGSATCTQLSGSIRTNSNTLKIGGDLYNGRFFKGEIDELSIYNRALSASELQAIFNAGSAGKCNSQVLPPKRPLIFIPGISGSELDEIGGGNIWPNALPKYQSLTLDPSKSGVGITTTTIIGNELLSGDIYYSLVAAVVNNGGYTPYNIGGDPRRLTYDGCNVNQTPQPTLFIYPYDWRKNNNEAASGLKEYVRCIQRIYSNTDIDILAHSQGGLVARRYILNNQNNHHIKKLISLNSPWLGAPKAVNVLETGMFLDEWYSRLITNETFKELSEFFPAVHELVPTKSYFDLLPQSESVYNNNGNNLSYDQLTSLLDQQFPISKPGTAGRAFHGRAGQDDWRTDASNVEYHHLYTIRRKPDTVGTVVQKDFLNCPPFFGCFNSRIFSFKPVMGDQTVPTLSAERISRNGLSLNAPGVTVANGNLKSFIACPSCNDDWYSHTGITRNPDVQAEILRILKSPATSTQKPSALSGIVPQQNSTGIELQPAYFLTVYGAASATLQDDASNTLGILDDPPTGDVPDVTAYRIGYKSFLLILPIGKTYTLTLHTGIAPPALELTKGTDTTTTQAIRYQDVALPAGVTAKLQITPQGVEDLLYDSNGDGTFETTVHPTASVTGSAAQDTEPPTVNVSATAQQTNMLVTINAADAVSGVKTAYYSLDGTNFQPYTAPFTVDPFKSPVVYAFADDNVANRSGLITYYPSVSSNQIDNAQFFVRQHYLDFLNREPDSSGLAFWTNELTSCGSNAQCQEVKRINVSAAFYLSIEFQQTGYLAYRAYKAAFGNIQGKPVPITREEMLSDMQQIGQGVVVGVGDWEQRLEQNKRAFFDQLVTRERFTTSYSQAMTPEQFVDALNANAGGALSQAERDALVNDLKSSAKTRARVLQAVAEDADLARAETNKAFVLMQYFGYLRRNPNDQPDTDFSGWQFWLSKLDQFNGNFVKAEMVKAFLSSIEYRQRFSAN